MRILLAQNALYYPAYGGGDRSNRLLHGGAGRAGHDCRVVARIARFSVEGHAQYLRELEARGVRPLAAEDGVVISAALESRHLWSRIIPICGPALRADCGVPTGRDPDVYGRSRATAAGGRRCDRAARVVYLARAPLALPFGPDCAFPSEAKTDVLRQADAVIGVSRYVSDYIRQWSGIPAVYVPISLPDPPPYPDLGRFENEFVTLVNPCAVKGISIFLELADRMPEVRFAAVPTWGATAADRAALERRANVTLLDAADNVDEIFRRTRVLLVPSLWAEARSRIVMEAMLRGVPVMASNVGGIPEAKLGVDYLLPVRPIEKYRPQLDDQMVPLPVLPPQDIGPWQAALERLLSDRAHYEAISRASRQAALADAAGLTVDPFEDLLEQLQHAARTAPPVAHTAQLRALEHLSPERRKLLALRLHKLSGAGRLPAGALRLFCFPHAGGGGALFHAWAPELPRSIYVVPMRAPRSQPENMAELVAALYGIIQPHLDEPFAFFGHSMGAVVAFEMARLLRRRNRPLPRLLVASGARAPQFRRGHVPPPEPGETEFVEALRRLEGTPREVLDDPEMLRLILPALREDAAIYRKYVYAEEPPLDCPILAYGGTADPNVLPRHLEAWALETTATFAVRLFPGGHFYLQTHRQRFLKTLAEDCAP